MKKRYLLTLAIATLTVSGCAGLSGGSAGPKFKSYKNITTEDGFLSSYTLASVQASALLSNPLPRLKFNSTSSTKRNAVATVAGKSKKLTSSDVETETVSSVIDSVNKITKVQSTSVESAKDSLGNVSSRTTKANDVIQTVGSNNYRIDLLTKTYSVDNYGSFEDYFDMDLSGISMSTVVRSGIPMYYVDGNTFTVVAKSTEASGNTTQETDAKVQYVITNESVTVNALITTKDKSISPIMTQEVTQTRSFTAKVELLKQNLKAENLANYVLVGTGSPA